jgi:lipopolysaccharide export system protein LptC
MNWRWISTAAALAALVVGYTAFYGRGASTPALERTPPQPGYYLNDAIITQTQEDGSLGMRVVAERIEQRPRDDAIAIKNVRVNYFQAPQKEWILTARRGLVPAGSQVLQLRGDVELRPSDASHAFLQTDALAIDVGRNVAHGLDSPTKIRVGPHTLTAKSFSADLNTEKLSMESVHGAYAPL